MWSDWVFWRRYPDSPYAWQGQAWRTLILEQIALERDVRMVRRQVWGKEAMIRTLRQQLERMRTLDIEMQQQARATAVTVTV
jgi:hypothetical protein